MRFLKKYGLLMVFAAIPLIMSMYLYRASFSSEEDCVLSLATSADIQEPIDVITGAEKVTDESSVARSKPQDGFNEEAKRKATIELVDQALEFVQKNPFDKALNIFTHGKEFLRGELYIFVYDMNNVSLANGQDARTVWKNLSDLRDPFGTYIVQEIVKKGKDGGGWVTYQWRNATKVSYVKPFTKDGKQYVIGSGYYPHSKQDLVVSLVKGAAAFFHEVVNKKGLAADEVFSTLSYPTGRFVAGDLYLYAVSFDGIMMANGDRPGLIGTNVLNVKDSDGRLINQEIINKLKASTEGIWIEYSSKNARKKTYAEKVTDAKGMSYFIACGFYPEVTPQKAVDLVKDGYEFMKKQGLAAAVTDFSDRRIDTYRLGDLYLIVYDMKGNIIAHGANADAIGINQWNVVDEDGKQYVRAVIEKAKNGGGWVDAKLKNAFQSIYVEKVELGADSYAISAGIYPVSKRETALLLSRSAAGYLRSNSKEKAFAEFTNPNGRFMRGDMYVFAIAFNGISTAWGDNYEMVWRNILNAKDDNGKPYVQLLINTVKQGPGQVTYKVNGHERVALVEMVEKDEPYVIGTGYYL